MSNEIEIHLYEARWGVEIARLFYDSVHAVDSSIYTDEQKEAWARTPPDYTWWSARLAGTRPYLAVYKANLLGFIEFDEEGYIDCFYVSPQNQGRGVGSLLYGYVEKEAREKGLKKLSVDASYIAKAFFAHRGFSIIRKNSVKRNRVVLENFTMEKSL